MDTMDLSAAFEERTGISGQLPNSNIFIVINYSLFYKVYKIILIMLFRALKAEVPVNWCPALGTVLANEEVVDGVSERGGHPVIRKVCCSSALSHFLLILGQF